MFTKINCYLSSCQSVSASVPSPDDDRQTACRLTLLVLKIVSNTKTQHCCVRRYNVRITVRPIGGDYVELRFGEVARYV